MQIYCGEIFLCVFFSGKFSSFCFFFLIFLVTILWFIHFVFKLYMLIFVGILCVCFFSIYTISCVIYWHFYDWMTRKLLFIGKCKSFVNVDENFISIFGWFCYFLLVLGIFFALLWVLFLIDWCEKHLIAVDKMSFYFFDKCHRKLGRKFWKGVIKKKDIQIFMILGL